MTLFEADSERAESYRILANLFFEPPDAGTLEGLREDLDLQSRESEHELLEDFDNLFVFPGGKLPPLESLYAEGEDAAGSVADFYLRAGLTFEEEYHLVPDHISLEFLFMSYLIDTGNGGLQEKFLDEHIVNWVPYYCGKIVDLARTLFYREIAEIMRDFVESEYKGS